MATNETESGVTVSAELVATATLALKMLKGTGTRCKDIAEATAYMHAFTVGQAAGIRLIAGRTQPNG